MRRLLFSLSLALTGCVAEIGLPEAEVHMQDSAVDVFLDITGGSSSKSSLSVDEYKVTDLDVMIYRDGFLEYSEYIPSIVPVMKVRLMEGYEYDIYVVANAGDLPGFAREDEFRENCLYAIDQMADLQGSMPMAWNRSGIRVREGMGTIVVQLERLAAKVSFSLDKDVLEGLEVTSVRLCQCASVVRPFKDMGGMGSRALSREETIPGDMASKEDLSILNGGGTVVFYALENCQGILLPDNMSPAGKVPEEVGPAADLCTYLEVAGIFGDEAFLEGEVVYRFYLGLDSCTSFDVPGNACIDVVLQLTGMGLHEVSWRVSADVSVREGYAWGSVVHGLHDVDDLYVGEKFRYQVEVSDEILSYVGGDASVCRLWLDSEQGAMEFSELEGDGNVYTSDVACRKSATGRLYLLGPDGEKLATLSQSVNVRPPKIVFSEDHYTDDHAPVEGLAYMPECIINGSPVRVYLYLTDSYGRNLNSSEAYGFDLDAFRFGVDGVEEHSELDGSFSSSFVKGDECSGGYVYELLLSCRNDGGDYAAACALAEAYSKGSRLDMLVKDNANGVSGKCGIGIGIYPVTLTLVDNRWAGYHSTQLSVMVENESELPLEISVCQVVDTDNDWSSSEMTTALRRYVEQNLIRESITYVTGGVCSHGQSAYVSSAEVQCVGSGVFALQGIETDDIMKSLIYDKLGNDRMYHLVDVTAGGFSIHGADVSLVNALSDGSSLYDTIYLSDWNSKGVWLFSNREPVSSPGNYLMHFPNLAPLNVKRLRQRYAENPKVGLTLWYDNGVFRGYSSYAQGVAYGLKMTLRWHGTVQGYVQTDPQGIWGSPQDHYCTASFDKTLKGVPLAGFLDYVSVDGGAVKAAMDAIYAQTFEDKSDGKKFGHSAHPVSMECNVEVFVEGENGEELYPMRVSWEYPYVTYYHAQDAMTYACQMSQNVPRFTMVHVAKKLSE
jgi:hypothetical protein